MSKPFAASYDTIRDLRFTLSEADPLFPKVDLMWQAMTDWPVAIGSLGKFLDILRKEIQDDLTAENLKILSQGQGIAPNLWIMESSWELALLFDYYPQAKKLDEVFLRFEKELHDKLEETSSI